jgi:hypothetical protein
MWVRSYFLPLTVSAPLTVPSLAAGFGVSAWKGTLPAAHTSRASAIRDTRRDDMADSF